MKVLNLYSGLGGNRKHWKDVEVVAVEKSEKIAAVYQENNPNDEVVIGDAHQYLLDHHHSFDFIWSSPPCQSHSKMVKATRHDVRKYPDLKLYEEIIFLQNFFKGKWIVENVKPYYEPLIKPICAVKSKYAYQIEQWMHEQLKVLNVKFHGSGKTEWFWIPALFLALPTLFFVWVSEWIVYVIAALLLLKMMNCI